MSPRFSKAARLTQKREFARLKSSDAAVRSNRYFGLRWLPSKKTRLGIVVSKKVDKATRRNLIKRVVRETFRRQPWLFPGGDVVVLAKPALKGRSRETMRAALQSLLREKR